MKFYLSNFDSLLFVRKHNSLINERDNIEITLFPDDNMFALYVNKKFTKVDADTVLEEVINQVINDFMLIDSLFTSI